MARLAGQGTRFGAFLVQCTNNAELERTMESECLLQTLRDPADPLPDPGDRRRSTDELRHTIARFIAVVYALLSTPLEHGDRPRSRLGFLLQEYRTILRWRWKAMIGEGGQHQGHTVRIFTVTWALAAAPLRISLSGRRANSMERTSVCSI